MNRGPRCRFQPRLDIYAFSTYNAFMPGSARAAANRRNTQKSTGPKIEDGKAAASRNALELHAKDFVCEHARRGGKYADFAAQLYADLAPANSVEVQLVDRIVTCTWRLQRVTLAETSLFDTSPGATIYGLAKRLTPAVSTAGPMK